MLRQSQARRNLAIGHLPYERLRDGTRDPAKGFGDRFRKSRRRAQDSDFILFSSPSPSLDRKGGSDMVRVAGRGRPGDSLPPRLLGFGAPGILRFFSEFLGSVRKDGNGDHPCPPTPGNQSRRFPQSAKPTGPPSATGDAGRSPSPPPIPEIRERDFHGVKRTQARSHGTLKAKGFPYRKRFPG